MLNSKKVSFSSTAFKNAVKLSIAEWYDRNMTSVAYNTNPNIIQRVLYPLIEKSNNTDNYNAAVASFTDSNSTVLFWATELK